MAENGTGEGAERVETGDSTVTEWMRRLALPVGDPGGGAASAVMLGVACALTAMVARYSGGRRGGGDDVDGDRLEELAARADERRAKALALADVDAERSREYGAAFHVPAGPEHDEAVRTAGERAAESSETIGDLALEARHDLREVAGVTARFLLPDALVATAALRAAIVGARTNLEADAGGLPEAEVAEHVGRYDEAVEHLDRLETELRERLRG